MSPIAISTLFAIGASVWVYNFLMKQTGGNAKTSSALTATAGFILFIIFWSVFDFIVGLTDK